VQATQLPPTHAWFALHVGLLPHRQFPALQVSALAGSQATHALPFEPQLASDGVRHTPLEQQPEPQVPALQDPQLPFAQI
jgi:hypothetical protein